MHFRLHKNKNNAPPANASPGQAWDPAVAWTEFRQGSELAFTSIYKRYVHHLYHYGERLTADKDLIEDSIHDFFVELWNQREGYGDVVNLKFYLLRGFKYRLIKNLKKARRLQVERTVSEGYNFEIVLSREFELVHHQASEEQKQHVLRGINSLTRREKEAITLRFYDGLSYEEIAEVMSLSVKSTYKLMYRAIDVLRKNIALLYSDLVIAVGLLIHS